MKPNVNNTDRMIRLIIGAIGVILIMTATVKGTLMYLTALLSLIMFVTGAFKFCPLYRLMGVSTCRK